MELGESRIRAPILCSGKRFNVAFCYILFSGYPLCKKDRSVILMIKVKVLQLYSSNNAQSSSIVYLGDQVLSALPKEKYETTNAFLCGEKEPDDPVGVADFSIYLNLRDSQIKGLRLRAFWRLFKILRKKKYDVIICNRFKSVSIMLVLSGLLHVPLCIGVSHGFGEYDRSYRRRQVRRFITPAWRFVGVSPAVKDYLIGLDCGFNENNTRAIYNAVDIDEISRQHLGRLEARGTLGLPLSGHVIGAIGRLVPIKGHRFLIEAFASLVGDFPDSYLAIIGDGREMDSLSELADRLGVGDRVYLLGFRKDAARYVKAFDVFAMPSLVEGLGLALLEGMAGELPIVASNIPAMLPLIQGAKGTAVPPADVKALAFALKEYMVLDSESLKDRGAQSFRYVLENHSLNEFRGRYLTLIEDSLGEVGHGRSNEIA